MKKVIALIISSCFITLQAQENSLLWEVSGNGLKQASYLYGTYHSKDARAHQFGDSVLTKLHQSDIVVIEYLENEQENQMEMMKYVLMKDKTLEDLISKKDFTFVKEQVIKRMGFMGMMFNTMKPLFTSTMVLELNARNEMAFTVDEFFKEEAKRDGIKLVGLETAEEAMASIDKISLEEQAKLLVEFFQEYDEQLSMGDSLIRMYQQQEIMKMHQFYKSMDNVPLAFDKSLLEERNKKFINRLIPYLENNSIFCAVGALHLPGESGLINGLRQKGYTVTPVFSQYHPTPLIIGRKKEWQYIPDDSLNLVMGFPEAPYYEPTTLTSGEKTINLIHYYITDSVNHLKYSVKAGKIESPWNIREVIESMVLSESLQKISETEQNFYGEQTTMLEFYVSNGKNKRTNIVIKNDILYIVELEGNKQNIYSDLGAYFFGGIYYEGIASFQEILDNTENYTIDMVGAALNENKDTIDTYQIYVINSEDTTTIEIKNEKRFSVSLALGHQYVFGFKKDGFQQKHLIVDVVESGTPIDSQYGFEFPMELTFIKGDANAPSTHVATIKYDPFTGYMNHHLPSSTE